MKVEYTIVLVRAAPKVKRVVAWKISMLVNGDCEVGMGRAKETYGRDDGRHAAAPAGEDGEDADEDLSGSGSDGHDVDGEHELDDLGVDREAII